MSFPPTLPSMLKLAYENSEVKTKMAPFPKDAYSQHTRPLTNQLADHLITALLPYYPHLNFTTTITLSHSSIPLSRSFIPPPLLTDSSPKPIFPRYHHSISELKNIHIAL